MLRTSLQTPHQLKSNPIPPPDFRFTEYQGVQVNPAAKFGAKAGALKPMLNLCAKTGIGIFFNF